MQLIPIGQAAQRLGVNTSTLRYYEDRGLLRPATRHGGRRHYSMDDLRRLAFLRLAHQLGLPLADAAAAFDASGPRWRELLSEQIGQLRRRIDELDRACAFLGHALDCPSDDPVRECDTLVATLDRLVDRATLADLESDDGGRPPVH